MNKLLFFVFLAILTIIVIISVLSIFSQRQPTKTSPTIPTPTPFSAGKTTVISDKVSLIYPSRQFLQSLSVVTPLVFEFSDSINPASVKYHITPKIDIEVRIDETGRKLTFSPESFWIPNTSYALILEEIRSEEDISLVKNYTLNFKALIGPDEISSDAEVNNQLDSTTPAPE